MQALHDMFPIAIFFIFYKLFDIYVATAAAMVTASLQLGWMLLCGKKPEIMHYIALGMLLVLGSATLLLHNQTFIQWKPTAVYWLLSLTFFGTQLFSKEPLAQRMLKKSVNLPVQAWGYLNLSWALFFLSMGILNLIVVFNFNTETWVNFKIFGTLGLTLLFVLAQSLYLARYHNEEKNKS
jgi:intracellular septation protein